MRDPRTGATNRLTTNPTAERISVVLYTFMLIVRPYTMYVCGICTTSGNMFSSDCE